MSGVPVFDPKADSTLSDEELASLKERYASFNAAEEIPRIVQETFGTLVLSWQSLEESANAFDHLVYAADIEQEGRRLPLVVRINAARMPDEMLPIETEIYGLLGAQGIAAPTVYASKLRASDRTYDYMVMKRIGSTSLESLLAKDASLDKEYARKAGAYLAQLHTIPLPGFGMIGEGLHGVHDTWSEALRIRLPETLAYLVEQQLLSEDVCHTIEHLFTHEEPSLARGVLLHGDFHPANIIIDEPNRKIAGAVDLSQAKVGDPLFDIAFYATYVSEERLSAFLEGYGRTPTDEDQDLLALYSLRIYLSKAKLRKRFGYEERIPAALAGIERALGVLG